MRKVSNEKQEKFPELLQGQQQERWQLWWQGRHLLQCHTTCLRMK